MTPDHAASELTPAYTISDCRSAALPPVVLASPHSGRSYPDGFLARIACTEIQLRRAEDAWMDRIAGHVADSLDLPLIAARWGRTFLDLNRAPGELDGAVIEDVPGGAPSDRLRAGLGVIPRVATPGVNLYREKLTRREARARIAAVHGSYHGALAQLIGRARGAHRDVLLIDCHSMPPLRAAGGRPAQIVLGDRHGASCRADFVDAVEAVLARKYRVRRNDPYAGGYTTENYGDPVGGVHAVQIEIDRSLYMDLDTLLPAAGMKAVADDLARAVRSALALLGGGSSSAGPLPLAAE